MLHFNGCIKTVASLLIAWFWMELDVHWLGGHLFKESRSIQPENWLWKGIRVGLFVILVPFMSTIVILLCMYDDYEFNFNYIPCLAFKVRMKSPSQC